MPGCHECESRSHTHMASDEVPHGAPVLQGRGNGFFPSVWRRLTSLVCRTVSFSGLLLSSSLLILSCCLAHRLVDAIKDGIIIGLDGAVEASGSDAHSDEISLVARSS